MYKRQGYDKPGTPLKPVNGNLRTWKFEAKNVHDFAWAADPDYEHISARQGNTDFHVVYKPKAAADSTSWKAIAETAVKILPFMNRNFGEYAYPQYSFIHGGDGGMEYPMCTMLVSASVGTAIHEFVHSWYQGMLGTNESLYAWMDEGFTSYAQDLVDEFLSGRPSFEGVRLALQKNPDNARLKFFNDVLPQRNIDGFSGYYGLQQSGYEEPLSTHADYFSTNYAYANAAYAKGAVFLSQIGYIIGEEALKKTMLEYYRLWRFKHPNAVDFLRVAETTSDMQLLWFRDFFVNTVKTIDYGIDSIWQDEKNTNILLRRVGHIPMPIDVNISYSDGSKEVINIPTNLTSVSYTHLTLPTICSV